MPLNLCDKLYYLFVCIISSDREEEYQNEETEERNPERGAEGRAPRFQHGPHSEDMRSH